MDPIAVPWLVMRRLTSMANPKSSSLAWPSGMTRMLEGLMSRWTRPCLWASDRAEATWWTTSHAFGAGSGPCVLTSRSRSWPETYRQIGQ